MDLTNGIAALEAAPDSPECMKAILIALLKRLLCTKEGAGIQHGKPQQPCALLHWHCGLPAEDEACRWCCCLDQTRVLPLLQTNAAHLP